MASICNKCKNLWCCDGKYYCNCFTYKTGKGVKYSKTKKQCEYFEQGSNAKKHMKSTSKGSCWNKKRK